MRFWGFILYSVPVWTSTATIPASLLSTIKSLAAAAPTGYAPQKTSCPSTPVVRVANGISSNEEEYIGQRKHVADASLSSWLKKISPDFDTSCNLPALGFSSSGGGERALLISAGVHEAFDERSSNASVAGLWQALTYESALSGGAIFLVDWAINNWEPLPKLISSFWQTSLNNGLLFPFGKSSGKDNATKDIIHGEIFQKALAGYPVSYVDLLGRLESYSFVSPNGGAASHIRDITTLPLFRSYQAPFPVFVSGGVNEYGDDCPITKLSDPQWEFNPFELGSWDRGISAFINITYLGSQPFHDERTCVTGYDSTGFAIGTSGDTFGLGTSCLEINAQLPAFLKEYDVPQELVELVFPSNKSTFAQYPNPFYNFSSSPAVSEYHDLQMVDGGLLNTDVAIWPLLYRNLDTLFVSDNSNDNNNYTNGTDMYSTYLRAQLYGLSQMPPIPDPKTFLEHGFENRNLFYGCNSTEYMTIVYMPNRDVVYQSNYTATPDAMPNKVLYGLVENGKAIGTNNGTEDWAKCVGCAIMRKSNTKLPNFCGACFSKYCAVF